MKLISVLSTSLYSSGASDLEYVLMEDTLNTSFDILLS